MLQTKDTGEITPVEKDRLPIIEMKNLVVHYETEDGIVEAVNDVSMLIKRGESFGLVGETGAGKTTIALSIMGLLPTPPSHVIQGSIFSNGENIFEKSANEMRKIRGSKISMVFQDPMTALNPVHRIGDQIAEVIALHQENKKMARVKAIEMLRTVGISEERFDDYPHQFSGGMKQRVVIAMALACRPELIIADEPTTALDVTIQAQVLELIKNLRNEYDTSLLLITHDFGVVAEICEKCAIIYAGEIVESGTIKQIFENSKHPYTLGLFASLPDIEKDMDRLNPIKGLMPNAMDLPSYCSFYDRCEERCDACKKQNPKLIEIEAEHFVKCLKFLD